MNDPYNILGVSPNASDDEVKKAYRDLVRKYHPDNYHDNPLSDLAQDKMKEVNEAYDAINRMRDGGGTTNGSYRPGSGNGGYYGSSEGQKIRAAINSGDLKYAEQLLNNFPQGTAEWNFLKGSLCYRKGWLDDALRHFQTAVNMEPGNNEYRQALAFMNQGGHAYSPHGQGQGQRSGSQSCCGCDACDCCSALCCINMCCCN